MDLFLLLVRTGLAGIFATAGAAKFADMRGSEKAFREFGVPRTLALPGSIALSVAEIILAIMFLFTTVSWYAAIGGSALLLLFIIQMIYLRSKGDAPDCHCFGQLHSEPVGIKSIVRNIIFLALAGLPLVRGPIGQGLDWADVTQPMVPIILGTLVVMMLGVALFYLRKISMDQVGLRRRIDLLELLGGEGKEHDHEHATDPNQGLPIGSPLPSFGLTSLVGVATASRQVASPGRTLFLFVSPTCEPCQALIPDLVKWKEEFADRVNFVFITSGDEAENRKKFGNFGGNNVLLDAERKFASAVGGRWTPTALLVDAEGKIASHIAAGDVAVEELIEKMRKTDWQSPFVYFSNGNHHGRGLKIGAAAPEFALTDVEGRDFRKADLMGKRTLVTFWSPDCPHCQNFIEEFRTWTKARSNGDPNVVLMSEGDIEDHRGLDLGAPVVIDRGYKTSARLGMFGTPSAVLVDENGVIATETAVGASNIWALLGRNNETN
jgi:thiol-disulfide isomerase/thioredoxin/uncharacterized membrane protein YphA (DoxX/SURF4 family)